MNARTLAITAVLLFALAWRWSSRDSVERGGASELANASGSTACTLPPRVAPFAPPLQTPVPASLTGFTRDDAMLTPLAGFSIDATRTVASRLPLRPRVTLAPTDLALGWGRMRDDACSNA
jgi:hypothetical protein